MAVVVTGFLGQLGDFGVGAAVVQQLEQDEEFADTAFWLNVAFSAALFGLQIMAAPLAALFFGVPEVRTVLTLTAFGYLFNAMTNVNQSMLLRRMQYDRLSLAQVVQSITHNVLLVGLVLLGFRFWSYPVASLVVGPFMVWVYWRLSPWRPRLRFSATHRRNILSFGRNVVAADFLSYVGNNLDYLLIGRFLGRVTLGVYTFAFEQAMFVANNVGAVVSRTMFPAYAQLQADREALRRAFLRTIGLVALAAFPLQLGQLILAPAYVTTVFGRHWQDAVAPFQFLLLYGLSRMIGAPGGSVLYAAGRPDIAARWNLVVMPVLMFAVVAASGFGIVAVAMAVGLIGLVGPWVFLAVVFRTLEWNYLSLLEVIRPPAVASGVMVVSVLLVQHFLLSSAEMGELVSLLVSVLVGGLVYIGVLFLRYRSAGQEILRYGIVVGSALRSLSLRRNSTPRSGGVATIERE